MKLTDTLQAGVLLAGYAAIVFLGLFVVESPQFGIVLIGASTAVAVVIVYTSWILDKMKGIADKRIQMYINGMNRAIRRELEREVQKHD